ncbi:hypothetical protein [Kibdelosporangium aridum]|uniref:hypothetical protein n=1 Tax=Kibdelosporangium aridum TaxID=2030 RepID=UPI000A83A1D6
MAKVVIQPSYGTPEARGNWKKTLDEDIDFRAGTRAAALTPPQIAALDACHPSGRARFWGTQPHLDTKMSTVNSGDIVLFTGGKVVRAVGEIGVIFRNETFADTLWSPSVDKGSYHNVYSLLDLRRTWIPYEEIWELPGFNVNDNFMGLRVLDDEKSATVIEGLGIESVTAQRAAIDHERQLSAALTHRSQVVPPEAVHTTTTTYERAAGTLTVNRAEALLLQAFRKTLAEDLEVGRVRMPVGVSDLHIAGPGEVEIVEAKSDSSRDYVRAALGQLLHYVLYSPQPATRLTALFPGKPAEIDIALLHRYGIDCVYAGESTFDRIEAPAESRHNMRQVWGSGA